MKTAPTEPGLYFHLSVNPYVVGPKKTEAYICKVSKSGYFWHPVHFDPGDARGSFIKIPEELHEAAWKEAKEVFVEEKAKWILRFQSEWDQKRQLEKIEDEFRDLVEARMKELTCL